MSRPSEWWNEYLNAARRKMEIASFHHERLRDVLTPPQGDSDTTPPVPVQSYFEGVIVSVMAAVDQIAQGVNEALQLHLSSGNLVEEAFARLSEPVREVSEWFDDPLGRDLRRIRARMLHYSYRKSPSGHEWTVESAETEYAESRELSAYAESAVRYGQRLVGLLPKIEAFLKK